MRGLKIAGNGSRSANFKPVDAPSACVRLEGFLRDHFERSGRTGIVVPISGGLDSSVVASLCVRAVGKDRVTGLQLPERWGNPEANKFGEMIAADLGIKTKRFYINGILRGLEINSWLLALLGGRKKWRGFIESRKARRGENLVDEYLLFLRHQATHAFRKYGAKINGRQRARLIYAYRYADEYDLLVVGAANMTERAVGLFAKFGVDDAADCMPLKNLYRSDVLEIAAYLKIPMAIRSRTSNPDMVPGVTDKYVSYLGIEARQLDAILQRLALKRSAGTIARELGLAESEVLRVREIVYLTEFQRTQSLSLLLG